MNDRFLPVRAGLLLARRALERQLALIGARERPDAAAFAEVTAHLDDALKELEALAKAGPPRVLPGGVANPDALRMDEDAVEFVKAFFDADKPVAAICHAPWVLPEAGVAKGRRLTSWPSLQTDLRNAGADWVDEEVVVDGNLVTSRKPDDLPAFTAELTELFSSSA